MAKNRVDKRIIQAVEKYIAEVKKHYNVDSAYIFGSYVHGTQHKDSDIDVAIALKDIKSKFDEIGKLYLYAYNIDARIEPHAFRATEFRKNETPLIDEIMRTGIKIV